MQRIRAVLDIQVNEDECHNHNIDPNTVKDDLSYCLNGDYDEIHLPCNHREHDGECYGFNTMERIVNLRTEHIYHRYCSECGKGMDEGYNDEENTEYFCSDKCLESNLNRTLGKGNWRCASDKEVVAIDNGDYGSQNHGYIFSVDAVRKAEEVLNIYHTDWHDTDDYDDPPSEMRAFVLVGRCGTDMTGVSCSADYMKLFNEMENAYQSAYEETAALGDESDYLSGSYLSSMAARVTSSGDWWEWSITEYWIKALI